MTKGRIVGIGGVFFKAPNTIETKEWYTNYLGMKSDQWGASFISKKFSKESETAYLQWSAFPEDSEYFGANAQQFMINYRVEYIEELVENLRKSSVKICKEIETFDYGKFAHIEDLNGQRIELWEPVDKVFDKMYTDTSNLNFE